jgi:hypothetical protein
MYLPGYVEAIINALTCILFQAPVALSESKRIAASILTLLKDVDIIPRGSYYLNATGNIQKNETFQGKHLSGVEIPYLRCIFHFQRIQ